MTKRRIAALVLVAQIAAAAGDLFAAETDNWTYRFLRLEDSAAKLNGVLNDYLQRLAEETNGRLRGMGNDPLSIDDTQVELTFVLTYRDMVLHRFGERVLPVFAACTERNDCPGWPKFERIALEKRESVYGQVHYNAVAIGFLAPSIDLCGVRVGTDKLTHLFSNGFFYYNLSRQKSSTLSTDQDVFELAMSDERGLMGARSTAVVSPADAQASVAGYRLASSYFEGEDPVFARDQGGLLVRRRNVDVCSYVTGKWDEVANPSTFTARRRKVERLRKAIAERIAFNENVWRTWSEEEQRAWRERILARRFQDVHVGLPLINRLYLLVKYPITYLTLPKDLRPGIHAIIFPRLKLDERRPIVLRRVDSGSGKGAQTGKERRE